MNGFKQLKKLASLALMLCIAFQLQAADVDLAKAKNVAKSFMAKQVANGRLRASATSNLKLAKAEPSTFKPDAVDYYIFNADKSYVIVSGDDQAPEILMYGEAGRIDVDNINPNMQWLLNKYKYQIDGLKAGTLKPNGYTPKATTAVAPLVTCTWDQTEPYYNHTPTSGNKHAYTGCPATSLSMCFYLYKWPKTYPAMAAIPADNYYGYLAAPALEEKAADWDNMLEHYGEWTDDNGNTQTTSYNTAQAEAVSWLMRYVGQACNMGYSTSGSGATDPEIRDACHTMGYTDATLYILTELQGNQYSGYTNSSQKYTDAQWNEWMLAELHAGRPIEYLAYDYTNRQISGHAFNVFGCDSNGKYYVNWGWSGDSNGYCTLHNFTTGTGATGQSGSYTFNYGEAMIINIAPPAGALGPQITVNPTELSFEGYVGNTYTKTFTVTGANLEGNLTISKQGSSDFTVSPTTITAANAANGVQVTVTYKPTAVGSSNATLTLSSTNAESVTVTLTGNGKPIVPELIVDPESLSFRTALGEPQTKSISVLGANLEGDVTIALTDQAGVFSVNKTTISKDEAEEGAEFNVTFSSEAEGTFNGTILLTSPNCDDQVTITLTGAANDGGTASDPYLNIAKYATIDDAGWRTALVNNLYKYTEYDEEAWLTLPIYGAWVGASYSTNSSTVGSGHPQTWIQTNVTSNSNAYAGTSWDSNEKLLGSSPYFTSATARAMGYNSRYNTTQETVSFFVTNTTAVQLLGLGQSRTSSTYPATLKVYECTLNADGTLTAGTTTVKSSSNSSTSGTFVLSANDLDANKIYKVEAATYRSYIAEIGFQTPLNTVGEPVITNVDPTTTTADVTWTTGEDNENWNLRYREYVGSEVATVFFDDFENGLDSWTIYTDGEAVNTNGWYAYSPSGDLGDAYSGSYVASSWSWYNNAYNADNWLITPQVTLGNEIEFYVRTNAKYPDSYEVLLSTTGKERTDFSVTLQEKVAAPAVSEWSKVSINTSDYKGQTGYIAIRHNDYDENYLLIDDFGIYNSISEWIYANSVTSPCTINSLTPETTYEVQVQGVNSDGKTSTWTTSTIFTTLAEAPVTDITLAGLESSGVKGNKYAISDELVAVEYKEVGDNVLLWCKDNNGATPITPAAGVVDFMVNEGTQTAKWDQSNWVVIKTTTQDAGIKAMEAKGKKISGVTGTYVDDVNYMIEVDDFTVGDEATVNLNNYCVANFNSSNWGAAGVVQNAVGNEAPNPQRFFFMTPKVQEVCIINYAQWNGKNFIVPVTSGFAGMLNVNYMYNTQDQATVEATMNSNIKDLEAANYPYYTFTAIVQVPTAGSAHLKGNLGNGGAVVYPSNLTAEGTTGPTTAISTVGVNGEVKSVKYVNVAGVVSDRPFQGVNIVVTEYSDGSRTTAKVVK